MNKPIDIKEQWPKILALLMEEFEIKEFEVTASMIELIEKKYDGELPVLGYLESDSTLKVMLLSKSEARRRVN